MSLSRWYFRVSQFARSSLFFGYKLMVHFKIMASQLITDLQEKAITFLEENQSLKKRKEVRRENNKSLWEKNRDMIPAFQDKNKVAWEKNITFWKKNRDPLEQWQDPTNGGSGGLGRGSRPMDN